MRLAVPTVAAGDRSPGTLISPACEGRVAGSVGRRCRSPATGDPRCSGKHDCRGNGVFGVAEVVIEALVAAAGGPADCGEREAPDGVAGEGQQVVPEDRHLEGARGYRDEGAGDGSDAPDEDGPVVPAVEPTFSSFHALV